jgi:hypothetical protein
MWNGAIVFSISAFALWMIARGYAKNLGPAYNTLVGAASGNGNAANIPGYVPTSPAAPTTGPGGIPNLVPQLTPPSSGAPGWNLMGDVNSMLEPAYQYTGAQFS